MRSLADSLMVMDWSSYVFSDAGRDGEKIFQSLFADEDVTVEKENALVRNFDD